jgi:hypothetical protein
MSGAGRGGEVNWVERYEALRAHALGGAPVAYVPLGLGVVRQRGVVAWMAVERRPASRRPPMLGAREGVEGRETDPLKMDLVRLVAEAVLLTTEGRAR